MPPSRAAAIAPKAARNPETVAGRDGAVLAPLGESTQVFQWHGCRFEVPADAVRLAQTDGCPPQAFRYDDKAYGFQFHLEVDESLIERWLATPSYRDELNAAGIGDESIRDQIRQHIATLQMRADAVFNGFLDLVGRPHRSRVLRSREWA